MITKGDITKKEGELICINIKHTTPPKKKKKKKKNDSYAILRRDNGSCRGQSEWTEFA